MTSDRDPLADLPWPEPEAPRQETSDAIRCAVTSNLTPSRGLGAGARFWLCVAVSAAIVAGVSAVLGGPHPGTTLEGALLGAGGWGVIQALILFVGLARPPGRRISRSLRLAIVIAFPAVFLAALWLGASHSVTATEFFTGQAHRTGALGCGVRALLAGAIAAGAVLLLFRHTDPMSPSVSGAVAGMSGGLAGAVAIGIACPSNEAWHLSVGHGLVVALLAVVGWAVGRRWLAP